VDDSKLNRHEILNENGKLYSVTTGPQSVAASGYLVLEINNLADSNKWMEVVRIEGGVNASTNIDILRNAPISVSGIALTPRNRNWSYADSSALSAQYVTQATDPTSGGELLTSVIQTGGSINIKYDGEFLILGGITDRQFSVRLANNTSQPNTLAISITWLEL